MNSNVKHATCHAGMGLLMHFYGSPLLLHCLLFYLIIYLFHMHVLYSLVNQLRRLPLPFRLPPMYPLQLLHNPKQISFDVLLTDVQRSIRTRTVLNIIERMVIVLGQIMARSPTNARWTAVQNLIGTRTD